MKSTRLAFLFHARLLSGWGFLRRAATILAFFGIAHIMEWREYTTVLSGTSLSGAGVPPMKDAVFAVSYMTAYFMAVVVAPILVLAAGIFLTFSSVGGCTRQAQADKR